jgi:hypothetical protein
MNFIKRDLGNHGIRPSELTEAFHLELLNPGWLYDPDQWASESGGPAPDTCVGARPSRSIAISLSAGPKGH